MENKDKIYKDLENYAKGQQGGGQFRSAPPPARKFPVNFLILLAIMGFLGYLWLDGSFTYNPSAPNNKATPSFIARLMELARHNKTLSRFMHSQSQAAGDAVASDNTPANGNTATNGQRRDVASSAGGSNDPNYVPTDDDIRTGRYVQINGKYFLYSPDHIYYVNGVKTYFVSNYKRQVDVKPPPPAPNN